MTRSKWLLRRPKEDATARLFCFPYSGSGASMFYRWPRAVGDLEICMIQLPGRDARIREPHYGTYEALCADLKGELAPYFDRPFGLFGHCGGALPAAELSRQLAADGRPLPTRLFVSSQVSPQDGPYGRFLEMSKPELAEALREQVRALGGTPSDEQIEIGLELLLPDLEANRQYRPRNLISLPCPITAIGWRQDAEIGIDRMQGWARLHSDCDFVHLDGGHYSFLDAPPALLALFARHLVPA